MTLIQGPKSSGSNGFQYALSGILCDKVYRLSPPYLLYQKGSRDAEFLQASSERIGIFVKKPSHGFILNDHELPSMGSRPFFTVRFENSVFGLEWGCRKFHMRTFRDSTPQ